MEQKQESKFLEFIKTWRYTILAISGGLCSFSFAPYFFLPCLFLISILPYNVSNSTSFKESFKIGWVFGFSFFFINLNWLVHGVSVFVEDFWWAIPVVVFILPAVLAIYIGLVSGLLWNVRNSRYFINLFACIWVIIEILRSYLFTGFAWNLISYSLAFSDTIIQITSVIGSYGLSAIVIYIFSFPYYILKQDKKSTKLSLSIIILIVTFIYLFGLNRLDNNPTKYHNIAIRIVQPSIEQVAKWDQDKFWDNFSILENLSFKRNEKIKPDIILWPEAAVTLPYRIPEILSKLRVAVPDNKAILVTGGITDNKGNVKMKPYRIYSSMYALKNHGDILFEYHKSHLVPFAEYVPYGDILPIKKLTDGLIDYYPGKPGFIVKLDDLNLKIRPLICYEISFPSEVRMTNSEADVIFNITNDAWFGKSGGPYQHFYKTRLRAVENGIPVIRSANNGISAIIDPLGRIIAKTDIDQRVNLDYYIPLKTFQTTYYSVFGEMLVYIYIFLSIVCYYLGKKFTLA